ncbi:FAD-dependent oxidoreductase [Thermogladius sp. KZ2Tp1]|uniref:FAD-dependent oxidoreductase n=1 Tax=Thermogladius sp. KZ2Tp1 TaxID=3136289 RepID=UPI003DA8E7DD
MRGYRIEEHPILKFRRGRVVKFRFNGVEVEGYEGESVLASLYALGYRVFSYSKTGRPRGAFCMIGKCSSCLARVNGVPNTRICIEPVRDGLVVETQSGLPEIPSETHSDVSEEEIEADAVVVGSGPAGLQAALTLAGHGLKVVLVEEHFKLGGQLVKQTHRFFGDTAYYGGVRGFRIGELLAEKVRASSNMKVLTSTRVYGFFAEGYLGAATVTGEPRHYLIKSKYTIVATGASERLALFENNDLPGVMGAGGAQTLMNEYGIRPGDRAIVVGSGNVGLIVAYQLLQAGVDVKTILELRDEIGGWFVHAAKIRRHGVPIKTRRTLLRVEGHDRVEKAVSVAVDGGYNPIPGTEEAYDVDLVLLAVGLQPSYALLGQMGAVVKHVPELGGLVPVRTWSMETSIPGVYVAGDLSGVEEATAAFLEGELAAQSILEKEGLADGGRAEVLHYLWNVYRMSPVLERARRGKLSVTLSEGEMEELRRGAG